MVQRPKQGYPNPAALEPLGWSPALFTSPSHSAQDELSGKSIKVYIRAKVLFLKLKIWTKNSREPFK